MEFLLLLLAFSKNPSLDDQQLSNKIKNGSQEAFKHFFDAHYPALYRFMRSRGMSHDEAEDLVQRAFVIIWEKRNGIDETKSLRAYLFQIAYSRMLNHIDYNSKFKDEDPPEDVSKTEDPDAKSDYSELLTQIKIIIASMPEKRAMVFELCFMKQFTYKETAAAMNVSVKTVENHMALALKDMRAALTNVYGEDLLNSFKT